MPTTSPQVTTLVNNMLGRQSDKDFVAKNAAALIHFTDVKSSDWYYQAVVEATNAHSFYKESGVETSWTSLKK